MESVPQSGNAPQVVHADDLAVLAAAWADSVEFGESDPIVKRVFGWVRDMYAFDFAARKVGVTCALPAGAAEQADGAAARGHRPGRGVLDALHVVADFER
jgi:hypothetical protein